MCIPAVNSNQRHAVHMLCKCYRVQWSEGSGRDRESKKSGRYESLNAHFNKTAGSYGLLKRFAVEYARFIRAPTLPNTFEQVGCFPTHVQTCRRASYVVRCSMNFETNVAGFARVLCYKKEEEYRRLWSKNGF